MFKLAAYGRVYTDNMIGRHDINLKMLSDAEEPSVRTPRKSNFLRFVFVVPVLLAVLLILVIPAISGAITSANNNSGLQVLRLTTPVPSAAPTPTPAPTPEATPEEPEPTPEETIKVSGYVKLQLNDDHPSVEKLQTRLMELGYLESDEPSTAYNQAVETAVSMFQRTQNVSQTGVADAALQETLFSDEASDYQVELGDTGTDIRSMQSMLKSLGYYEDKVNGYFGTATEDALKAFQKKNDLSTDGVYNMEDRELMFSEAAKPLVDPTPKPKSTPKKKPKNNSSSNTPSPSSSSHGQSSSPHENYPTGGSFNATGNVSGVISVATAQIGKQYVTGDEGPDTFDCSGLVYYCFKQNGVSISRRSSASYAENNSWTLITDMHSVRAGDMLFFRSDSSASVSHVGICIGSGKMIDASSSNGKVMRRSHTSEYWSRNFVCARRVFG